MTCLQKPMLSKSKIVIYTDGACSGNPGHGGYAAILIYGNKKKIISGHEDFTTNNRMELKAVIEALKAIKKKNIPIEIYTDSTYVQKGVNLWLENWKKRGFKKVKNVDLWIELDKLINSFKHIKFIHVKGHSGNSLNQLVDSLAKKEIRKNHNL